MTDDKTTASPTYDSKLNDIYAPQPERDLSHLAGMTVQHHPQGVVTDKDYDRLVAEAQRVPSSNPSAPAVAPIATPLDLSTARTATGQRVSDPTQATADTIVTFKGMETTLGALLALGEVTRDATGQYVTGTPEANQEQTQAPPQSAPLDERSEAIMAEALAKAPGQVAGAAASLIANGVASDEAVAQVAASMGLEPTAAREQIDHVAKAYAAEAAQLGAKAADCSVEVATEALNWARTEKASELKEIAQRHFNEGSAVVDYKPFVVEYLATLDQRDPQRILTANPVEGRKVHWDRGNNCVVVTMLDDGTQMSWETAVRTRRISM